MTLPISMRRRSAEDDGYILSTWKRALITRWATPRGLSTKQAYAVLNLALDMVILPESDAWLCTPDNDPETIVGCVVLDAAHNVLHHEVKGRFASTVHLADMRALLPFASATPPFVGFDPFTALEKLCPSRPTI